MITMFGLKRSDTLIKRKCKQIGDSLVAMSDIKVYVPVSYEGAKLLILDERLYSLACMMYTDGKEYGVINCAAVIELGKTEFKKVKIVGFDGEETECYEFSYEKGDKIHPTNKVPKDAQLSYPFVNHLLLMAKTVPFFDRWDVDRILDSIPRFCGFGVPEYGYLNHFTEMITRSADDIQVPLRLSKSVKFVTVPFSSVVLNVSSVIGKNRGGYLEDGIMSATTITSESSTAFEKVLRA